MTVARADHKKETIARHCHGAADEACCGLCFVSDLGRLDRALQDDTTGQYRTTPQDSTGLHNRTGRDNCPQAD